MNWVTKVAWHEVQTEWHRQARTSPELVSELSDGLDPARIFIARQDLEAVGRHLGQLNAEQRETILSALDDVGAGSPLEAKVKMRRRRARQRLAAFLESNGDDRPS